ncbi:hypothetical protein pb186bvf_009377 [Paramecium bursaria]
MYTLNLMVQIVNTNQPKVKICNYRVMICLLLCICIYEGITSFFFL